MAKLTRAERLRIAFASIDDLDLYQDSTPRRPSFDMTLSVTKNGEFKFEVGENEYYIEQENAQKIAEWLTQMFVDEFE